jgi:DNA-binding response OmpR family regulator
VKQTNILVVEDDEIVARTIERCFRGSDNRVRIAGSGVEGLQAARREVPDIIILDVVLPGMDGYTVCKELRSDALLADVPVLFLTAKTRDEDKITGLTAGADDYLSKPFNIDELLLRVQAILRRTRGQRTKRINAVARETIGAAARAAHASPAPDKTADTVLTVGQYKLFTRTYHFYSPGTGKIRLTPVQYDILYHMMSHPGEVFTPSRLLDEIWDYPTDAGSPDLVRVHIKNIREKVEKDPHRPTFIKTVAGFGYTIEVEDTEAENEQDQL